MQRGDEPNIRPKSKKARRATAGGIGLALVAGGFATQVGPFSAGASSHREAPLIAGDPRADNTDVYAFVSPDATNSVTLIANWMPFEEPNGGPNFYTWADDTRYNIKIDNDGDALADLTYTWIFDTVVRDAAGQFLNNTGPITSLTDPDLNVYQTYDLTVTNGAGVTTALLGDGNGVTSPNDPIAAPSLVGPASTPDYGVLRTQATYNLPANGGKSYAGQADDSFFLDLRVFDLLYGGNASEVGQDTLAGYNVNTIALQVPQSAVAINNNATANPVIGIWSTTDRRSAQVGGDAAPDNQFVQVSRLGNPLVNEVVIPLALKDAFNSIGPDADAGIPAVVDKVLHPILPELIEGIYGVPAPNGNRNDLFEIFLQGVSKANSGLDGDPAVVLNVDLNSQDLNAGVNTAGGRGGAAFRPSEMLRLNMSVPPAAVPNRLGVLAGDVQGFPNGRRLTDDVLDIAIQAVEGAAQSGVLVAGLATIDSVDRNDREFSSTFPYVALPNTDGVNLGTERTPRAPEFVSVNPERVLETRTTEAGGQKGYVGAKPTTGQVIEVQVTGTSGAMVPTDAATVFLNVTAVGTEADGFVTVYPCGSPRPVASNFNPLGGTITHNLVAAKVGTGGKVCIFTSSSTDLLVDIAGYHPSTAKFVSTLPQRVLETRTTETGGQIGYTGAKPADGQILTLKVTGVGAAAIPADAKAVFLNVTAVNSSAAGWITAYPCGSPTPGTSNVNLVPGLVRANLVASTIGTGGNVCLFVSKGTDVIADIEGYVPASSSYVSVVPERILETRATDGQVNYSGSKPIAGQTVELKVTNFGTSKVTDDSGTVLLNLTVTDSAAAGFVTVYACGSPRPLASNINLTGLTTPELVAAKVGDGGRVCIFTSAETNLVADILGYFPGTILS